MDTYTFHSIYIYMYMYVNVCIYINMNDLTIWPMDELIITEIPYMGEW